MIRKIDIKKFGLFQDYLWSNDISKTDTFKRLNIIYGRNYSGKTTLSRVFKCIEDSCIHKNYVNCEFEIKLTDGKIINHQNLCIDHTIRVYNSDFSKENLSWLYNDDGTIKPFTILGAKNISIEQKVKDIEYELGSIEEKRGVIYELEEKKNQCDLTRHAFSARSSLLEDKLRRKANDDIKLDSNLFVPSSSKKNYTISDIKTEVLDILKEPSRYHLSNDEVERRQQLLKEISLTNITKIVEPKPNFPRHYVQVKDLLSRKIKPSISIMELLNDNLLQEWVRQGIDKHKHKRATCGFCGGSINDKLWEKLSAHFSKESEDLLNELKVYIEKLEEGKLNLNNFLSIKKEVFYPSLSQRFDLILKEWKLSIDEYSKSLNALITELREREKNIFVEREILEIVDCSYLLCNTIQNLNELIELHNNKSETLYSDQKNARIELRKDRICHFIKDIDYENETKTIQNLENEVISQERLLNSLQKSMADLDEQKRNLEAQAKDESRGAELVNQHLSHFFGHNELKLTAEGETPNMKFIIQRHGSNASNLSEGECSLISFCYFIARMEDELKDENNAKELIIYIDDPISSLDSNHIFFMFSLIESVITKPKKYGQLFISTHNLDFLKYLRRLTIPKFKPPHNSSDKEDVNYFIIERKNQHLTSLKLAPNYLRKYITEFNYLFKQIYKCSISSLSDLAEDYQYNFGNNLRKFLEAYLFYKYPSHKLNHDARMKKYFTDDRSYSLINRVINEYSHLEEQFDRSIIPIDLGEIQSISIIVMSRIESSDLEQYKALVESVE